MMELLVTRLQQNWKSGLTVALVSIPLTVSLSVASNTTPVVGIITAIWASIIAAAFGSSKYNVVGVTSALSGILAAYSLVHGAQTLAMLAIVSGVMIIGMNFLRLERFFVFIPASTIRGFTMGVALIILLNQINFAFGLSGLEKHQHFIDNILESFRHIYLFSPETFVVFLTFLGTLFLMGRFMPRLPGAIILAPIGILLGYADTVGWIQLGLETLGDRYPLLIARLFLIPEFNFDISLLTTGFVIAVIAIIETSVSAKVADSLMKTRHNNKREIFGLGIANVVTGLMGGIPATASFSRTAVNIKSGATDRWSAVISGFYVALISLVFLVYFAYIPLAVIAAILVNVAIRMIEFDSLALVWKNDRVSFFLTLLVAGLCVYKEPIYGIFVGIAISLLILVEKISRGEFDMAMNDVNTGKTKLFSGAKLAEISHDSHILVYSIKGPLVYINAQPHVMRFENGLKEYHSVILRLKEVYFIDTDGVEAFEQIVESIMEKKKQVVISGLNESVEKILERESPLYRKLKKTGNIFNKTTEALHHLGYKHI